MKSINSVEKAGRNYGIQMGITMGVVYPIFLFSAIAIIKRNPEAWWVPLLALIPMIPILFGLGAILRFFDRMDELQRRIQLTALAIAAGGVSIVTMTYGFLEWLADFPQLDIGWTFPILCIFWVGGLFFAQRKYA